MEILPSFLISADKFITISKTSQIFALSTIKIPNKKYQTILKNLIFFSIIYTKPTIPIKH